MPKPTQRNLFNRPTFNVVKDQKTAMVEAVKNSGLSREEVVDLMNELADKFGIILNGKGVRLTLDTFEKWINPAELNRQMPMRALPVFCSAVNNNVPLDILALPLGCCVIDPEERKLLDWAKLYMRARRDRKEMKRLEDLI